MRKRGIPEEGITRRSFLKGAVATGTAGFLGVAAFGTLRSLMSPEIELKGEVRDTFMYLNPERARLPVWYENLIGEDARLSHFEPGMGANVLWKRIVDEEGSIVPGSGFPAILIQMEEDELEFPEGYSRDEFVIEGLYSIFNCCTHACCPPGWKLIPVSDYKTVDPENPDRDNIYCVCHDSQYNPRRVAEYQHPSPPDASGAEYIGVYKVPGVGPADRGMPLIPLALDTDGDRIVGVAKNQDWYRYLLYKDAAMPE
ncbi:MAG: hypothetical protein ACE5HJ_01240 [Thermoplasmata archaeon]